MLEGTTKTSLHDGVAEQKGTGVASTGIAGSIPATVSNI